MSRLGEVKRSPAKVRAAFFRDRRPAWKRAQGREVTVKVAVRRMWWNVGSLDPQKAKVVFEACARIARGSKAIPGTNLGRQNTRGACAKGTTPSRAFNAALKALTTKVR